MAEKFEAGIAFGVVAFEQVKRQLSEIRDLLFQISGQSPQSRQQNQGMDNLKSTMSSLALSLGEARNAANSLLGFGSRMTARYKGFFMDIMNVGSQFQNSRRQFELVFGDQEKASEAFQKTLTLAEKTSLSTLGVLQGVPMMQRRQVDALKSYEHQMMRNGKLESVQLSRLELINDLISGSGQRQELVWFNLNMALGGLNRNFRALFDGVETEADRKAYKAAKTAEERMEIMSQIILKNYAGTSAAMEGTYGFIMANLTDVMQNVKGILGESLGSILADGTANSPMQKLLDFVSSLKNDQAFLDSLRVTFEQIAVAVGKVIDYGTQIGKFARDFIVANPQLTKFVIMAGAAAGIMATFVGKMGLFLVGMQSMVTFLLPALFKLSLLLGTAAIPVFGFLKDTFDTLKNDGIAGLTSSFERFGLVVRGVFEIVSSYNKGVAEMSGDTVKALEKEGLFGLVTQIGGKLGYWKDLFVYEIGPAVMRVASALSQAFKALMPILIDAVIGIGNLFDAAARHGVFEALADTVISLAKVMGSLFMLFGDIVSLIFTGETAMSRMAKEGDAANTSMSNLDAVMVGLKSSLEAVTSALTALAGFIEDVRSALDPSYQKKGVSGTYSLQRNDTTGQMEVVQTGKASFEQYSLAQRYWAIRDQASAVYDLADKAGKDGDIMGSLRYMAQYTRMRESATGILGDDKFERAIAEGQMADRALVKVPVLNKTGIPQLDAIMDPAERRMMAENYLQDPLYYGKVIKAFPEFATPASAPPSADKAAETGWEKTVRELENLRRAVESNGADARDYYGKDLDIGSSFSEMALDMGGGRP